MVRVSPPIHRPHTPCIPTPNARLTPLSRERLLRRHIDRGEPLKELAVHAGISLRTAYKWLARYRSGGHTSRAY